MAYNPVLRDAFSPYISSFLKACDSVSSQNPAFYDGSVTQLLRESISQLAGNVISSSEERQEDLNEVFSALMNRINPGHELFSTLVITKQFERTSNTRIPDDNERSARSYLNDQNTVQERIREWQTRIQLHDNTSTTWEQYLISSHRSTAGGASAWYLEANDNLVHEYRPVVTTLQWQAPAPYVHIVLNRFSDTGFKITTPVPVPLVYTQPAALLQGGEQGVNYELISFYIHEGTSLRAGHYTAYVQKEGQWFKCDDRSVKAVNTNAVDTEDRIDRDAVDRALLTGYGFIYRRNDAATPTPNLATPPPRESKREKEARESKESKGHDISLLNHGNSLAALALMAGLFTQPPRDMRSSPSNGYNQTPQLSFEDNAKGRAAISTLEALQKGLQAGESGHELLDKYNTLLEIEGVKNSDHPFSSHTQARVTIGASKAIESKAWAAGFVQHNPEGGSLMTADNIALALQTPHKRGDDSVTVLQWQINVLNDKFMPKKTSQTNGQGR